jgi:hypothetical protein
MTKLNTVLTGLLVVIATMTAATTIASIQRQLAYAITPAPVMDALKNLHPDKKLELLDLNWIEELLSLPPDKKKIFPPPVPHVEETSATNRLPYLFYF